jgi:hypothetical protein
LISENSSCNIHNHVLVNSINHNNYGPRLSHGQERKNIILDLSSQLTTHGRKIHSQVIHLNKLKKHHIKRHFKHIDITWPTVLALIQIESAEPTTIIIDSVQGIYIVKQTVNRLFKQLERIRPVGRAKTMRRIANYKDIFEYIPFVFCGRSLSPMKAQKHFNVIWFASEMITHFEPGETLDSSVVWFENANVPIAMNLSAAFINNRKQDAYEVRDFGELIGVQIAISSTAKMQTSYNHYQLEKHLKELEGFQAYAREQDIREIFQLIGYQATDDEIKCYVKKLIGN